MSDLTFSNLNDDPTCPDNSFVVINNKVYLDVGLFIDESITQLTQAKVTELFIKLGQVGYQAQVAINTGKPTGQRINSFGLPSYSVPAQSATGVNTRITVTGIGLLTVNNADIEPLIN